MNTALRYRSFAVATLVAAVAATGVAASSAGAHPMPPLPMNHHHHKKHHARRSHSDVDSASPLLAVVTIAR